VHPRGVPGHARPGSAGGRIINNGSISAQVPRPRSAPYTATKHAIAGLTKSTSLDGHPYNIACGQIDVGNASTQMTDAMALGVRQADGGVRPEPRMAVQDVVRAVLYMASLPLDSNVANLTVLATAMPYVSRGHRRLERGPCRRPAATVLCIPGRLLEPPFACDRSDDGRGEGHRGASDADHVDRSTPPR
jgi:hypothetical protein